MLHVTQALNNLLLHICSNSAHYVIKIPHFCISVEAYGTLHSPVFSNTHQFVHFEADDTLSAEIGHEEKYFDC